MPHRFDGHCYIDAEKLPLRIGPVFLEKIVRPLFDGTGVRSCRAERNIECFSDARAVQILRPILGQVRCHADLDEARHRVIGEHIDETDGMTWRIHGD